MCGSGSFNSYKERELVDSLMACMKQIKARDTGNCQNPVCSRRLVLANVFPHSVGCSVQSLSCKMLQFRIRATHRQTIPCYGVCQCYLIVARAECESRIASNKYFIAPKTSSSDFILYFETI